MSKRKDNHAHFFQGVVGQLLTSWEFWYGASQKKMEPGLKIVKSLRLQSLSNSISVRKEKKKKKDAEASRSPSKIRPIKCE